MNPFTSHSLSIWWWKPDVTSLALRILVILPCETQMARLKDFSPEKALSFPKLHSVSLICRSRSAWSKRIVFSYQESVSVMTCQGICYQLDATACVSAYSSLFRAVLPAGRWCASSLIPFIVVGWVLKLNFHNFYVLMLNKRYSFLPTLNHNCKTLESVPFSFLQSKHTRVPPPQLLLALGQWAAVCMISEHTAPGGWHKWSYLLQLRSPFVC